MRVALHTQRRTAAERENDMQQKLTPMDGVQGHYTKVIAIRILDAANHLPRCSDEVTGTSTDDLLEVISAVKDVLVDAHYDLYDLAQGDKPECTGIDDPKHDKAVKIAKAWTEGGAA